MSPTSPDHLTQAPRTARQKVTWVVKLLMSIGLLGWILRRAELSEVFGAMGDARLGLIAGALAVYGIGWTISILRWRELLRAVGVEPSPVPLVQSYLSGKFFDNLLPSTVGGDSLRAYDSWTWGASGSEAIAVITLDRLIGVCALIGYAGVGILLAPRLMVELPLLPLWIGVGALAALGTTAFMVLPEPPFLTRLRSLGGFLPESARRLGQQFLLTLEAFRTNRRAVRRAFLLSVGLQFVVIVHYFLIASALSLPITVGALFLVIPLSLAIMAIPLSVNAIGIRENVFAFFLAFFGVGTAAAVAFAWISFGLILFQGLVGGIVYATRRANPRAAADPSRPGRVP